MSEIVLVYENFNENTKYCTVCAAFHCLIIKKIRDCLSDTMDTWPSRYDSHGKHTNITI